MYLKEVPAALSGSKVRCYHCGEICDDNIFFYEDKSFCCAGCKAVYEILSANNLCTYYRLDNTPGISFKDRKEYKYERFSYIDSDDVSRKILSYKDDKISVAELSIPSIHCSSCIWLLENLHKIDDGIITSEVNFPAKTVRIRFKSDVRLSRIVGLLARIGYEPEINLGDIESPVKKARNRSLYYKIGIAGFCFGNIMILSFPEYLSIDGKIDYNFRIMFGALNIILALPVFFYSATDYFISAIKALRAKSLNIDFPISLGLVVLFLRSVYEISTGTGAGFMDSFSGLVFFLLVGKLFQNKTYESLNFDRTYKSYFPAYATVINKDRIEKIIPITELKTADRILIRNDEIIPADAILFRGTGNIDYSFVTGESLPVNKVPGEIIYAGARQTGGAIELEVIRTVNQSHLTSLWNRDIFRKKNEYKYKSVIDTVGKYFTIVITLIASAAFIYWYILYDDLRTAINAFTAVLIIACPCGIALTNPFALGNALRILGKNGFYAKNSSVIEQLSEIDTIALDKTGTLTIPKYSDIKYRGIVLSVYEIGLVKSAVNNSSHALSRKIYNSLKTDVLYEVQYFHEYSGRGISAIVDGNLVRLGRESFVNEGVSADTLKSVNKDTKIFLSINGIPKGYFSVNNVYREKAGEVISELADDYGIYILSGDNDGEKKNLMKYIPDENKLKFNLSPHEKLDFIAVLQERGQKVLMIGDGLNDAGAFAKSDVSVSLCEDLSKFTPASSVIMDSSQFSKLPDFLKFTKDTMKIIFASYVISVAYNLTGITLAFKSEITPLMAAVLMPLASVTVVVFTISATNLLSGIRRLIR
jgi:Cu+-exporting ATPase